MATAATPATNMAMIKPCISSSRKVFMSSAASFSTESKEASWNRLTSSSHISSSQPFFQSIFSAPIKFKKGVTRAMSAANENKPLPGLPVDLRGQASLFSPIVSKADFKIRSHLCMFFTIMIVALRIL
jgi:enoyl-[acyl-carrier protein] reductase I